MTDKLREAAQQVVDSYDHYSPLVWAREQLHLVNALRSALAEEPKQEPILCQHSFHARYTTEQGICPECSNTGYISAAGLAEPQARYTVHWNENLIVGTFATWAEADACRKGLRFASEAFAATPDCAASREVKP